MKTFEQCCDEVAKKWGLSNYESLKRQGRPDLENFYTKAAELYAQEFAREKVKEAVKLAREIEYGELYEHSPVTYTEEEILEKLKL